MKILLVEDDADVRDLTAYSLRRERLAVIEAGNGHEAIQRIRNEHPDLVVLDLGLPRQDGLEVIRTVRQSGDDVPIIVLTGRRDEKSIIECFKLNVDDYVTKPFSAKELALRVRAVLRRVSALESGPHPLAAIEVGGLRLDPETHEVTAGGEPVELTPIEFRILYLLTTNAGRTVTSSRILPYVWGHDGGDANVLRTHISHVRRKLAQTTACPGEIKSASGVGYRFVEFRGQLRAAASQRA